MSGFLVFVGVLIALGIGNRVRKWLKFDIFDEHHNDTGYRIDGMPVTHSSTRPGCGCYFMLAVALVTYAILSSLGK